MEHGASLEQRRELVPRAGLCARCRYLRVLSNGRSLFVFCRRSETDPRFPRYPGLPVRFCGGFEAVPAGMEPPDP